MASLPTLSGRDVVKVFARDGWQMARQRGSHMILVKTATWRRCPSRITGKLPRAPAEPDPFQRPHRGGVRRSCGQIVRARSDSLQRAWRSPGGCSPRRGGDDATCRRDQSGDVSQRTPNQRQAKFHFGPLQTSLASKPNMRCASVLYANQSSCQKDACQEESSLQEGCARQQRGGPLLDGLRAGTGQITRHQRELP